MNAYSELYLNDAKLSLGQMFSYLMDDCDYSPEKVWEMFRSSGYAELFERGNPGVISGMSGIELGKQIIENALSPDLRSGNYRQTYIESLEAKEEGAEYSAYNTVPKPNKAFSMEKSPAYWVGWALAEYQWLTGRRFKEIIDLVPMEELLDMYEIYHEMDLTQFVHALENKLAERSSIRETNLKRIREARGISQGALSGLTGVGIRSIQMYEQRKNDIDKAQGHALYKLSRALGCSIEDLLENPSN